MEDSWPKVISLVKKLLFILMAVFTAASAAEKSTQERLSAFLQTHFKEQKEISLRPLTAGWSRAKLYQLNAADKQYALRLQNLAKPQRLTECYIVERASEAGITPHVHHIDWQRGVILMDFINGGETIRFDQACQLENIRTLAAAVRTAHTIPKAPYSMDRLIHKIRKYYSAIKGWDLIDSEMKAAMETVEELYADLDAQNHPCCMIHGDLHVKNIFLSASGKILLIDWEETRFDDPFFDLAYSSCTLNFDAKQQDAYLEAYLSHSPTSEEWKHYLLCKNITALAFHFELLELAFMLSDQEPFERTQEPLMPWAWYMERFTESAEQLPAAFIYAWAQSAKQLYYSIE